MSTCQNCSQNFSSTSADLAFYAKIQVPEPKFCIDCRQQRRLSFRNERILYKRKCDLSGKTIISVYNENVPFPVYDNEEWHSDKWESTNYGMDFDFNRPFFDQFAELYNKVPRISLMNQMSENSDYCNYAFTNKNSYLLFGSHYNEDSLYGNYIFKAVKCVDCIEVLNSELIYEGIYSDGCYHCAFIQYCFDSSDCFFCYDLVGCKNCIFSSRTKILRANETSDSQKMS